MATDPISLRQHRLPSQQKLTLPLTATTPCSSLGLLGKLRFFYSASYPWSATATTTTKERHPVAAVTFTGEEDHRSSATKEETRRCVTALVANEKESNTTSIAMSSAAIFSYSTNYSSITTLDCRPHGGEAPLCCHHRGGQGGSMLHYRSGHHRFCRPFRWCGTVASIAD